MFDTARRLLRLEAIVLDLRTTVERVERKLDHIHAHQLKQEEDEYMDRAELDRLVQVTSDNTDATQAATVAMTGLVTSNEKLTTDLQKAIASAGADTTPDVKAAADAIVANNQRLRDAIPKIANAVVDNTPAQT